MHGDAYSKDRRKNSLGPAVGSPRLFQSQSTLPQVIVNIDFGEIVEKLFKNYWNWERSVMMAWMRYTLI